MSFCLYRRSYLKWSLVRVILDTYRKKSVKFAHGCDRLSELDFFSRPAGRLPSAGAEQRRASSFERWLLTAAVTLLLRVHNV